mmetsp:Transcript_38856/g.93939  ORF Transcript_38856/g.93939 Transcript_38856/m.93939 type:complete len:134 (+) Transcript_38856:245-646(+)
MLPPEEAPMTYIREEEDDSAVETNSRGREDNCLFDNDDSSPPRTNHFNKYSIRLVSLAGFQHPLFRSTQVKATGMYPFSNTSLTMRNSSDKPTQLGHVPLDGEKNLVAECVQACSKSTMPFGFDLLVGMLLEK